MTTRVICTEAQIRRAIRAAQKEGLPIAGMRPDGTDLMKLFDWSSPAVAIKYIQMADKKRATERTIKLLSRKGP